MAEKKQTELKLEEKPKKAPAKKKAPVKKSEPKPKPTPMKALSKVYLRKAPNFEGEVVRIVDKDEIVEVIEIKNDWAKVKEGYILAEILGK
jgi:hypothetical protein